MIRDDKARRREERVKARKAEVAKLKEKMMVMRRAMQLAEIPANIQVGKAYQDLFRFLEMEDEAEMRQWLREPRNLLLVELYIAELLARRGGKRKTMDTHGFEANLFENLVKLQDALWSGNYYPSRGTVHVIFDPVQREIFAAPYVDRILHHWIVGTIIKWQDKRLIYDSYSCRKGKGTQFGVKRLQHHILSVSHNMKRKAYVVQLDISGYFMHIRRDILYKIVKGNIDRQFLVGARDKRYRILLWAVCG